MVVADARVPEAGDLWQLTMEHSPVGMAIVSPAGDFVTANVALCDMLGYDPDVMATLTFQDITHPDDLAADLRLVGQALAGEISSYRITKRYICADGSIVIGDLSVALLRDARGAPVHFISQIADLTERQAFVDRLDAAEAAAEAERRTALAVFEGVDVGLLRIDARGHFLSSNTRLREFLGLAFPEGHLGLAGQPGFAYDDAQQRLLAPEEMPCVRAVRGEEFDDVRVWIGEEPTTRRALSVSARTVLDRAGAGAGAVLAYHDVTDLVRAMHVKDEFVATVSHELRTPLTSALAHLELLDESADVSVEGQLQVAAARRNMLRLSRLVADLLFTSRAAAGSPLVAPHRVDLVTVVDEAVAAASLDAEVAGLRLTCSRPASVLVECRWDAAAPGHRQPAGQRRRPQPPRRGDHGRADRGRAPRGPRRRRPRRRHRPRRGGRGVRSLLPRPERPTTPGPRHRSGPHHRAGHRRGPRWRGDARERTRGAAPPCACGSRADARSMPPAALAEPCARAGTPRWGAGGPGGIRVGSGCVSSRGGNLTRASAYWQDRGICQ